MAGWLAAAVCRILLRLEDQRDREKSNASGCLPSRRMIRRRRRRPVRLPSPSTPNHPPLGPGSDDLVFATRYALVTWTRVIQLSMRRLASTSLVVHAGQKHRPGSREAPPSRLERRELRYVYEPRELVLDMARGCRRRILWLTLGAASGMGVKAFPRWGGGGGVSRVVLSGH